MNIEIELTPTNGPVDEPLHGLVRGLPAGDCVSVSAQLRDSRDQLWRSQRTFTAHGEGVAAIDADELVSSLTLGPTAVRRPFDNTSLLPLLIEFTVEHSGRDVAASEVRRLFVADEVLAMRVHEQGLSGMFFQPASVHPK